MTIRSPTTRVVMLLRESARARTTAMLERAATMLHAHAVELHGVTRVAGAPPADLLLLPFDALAEQALRCVPRFAGRRSVCTFALWGAPEPRPEGGVIAALRAGLAEAMLARSRWHFAETLGEFELARRAGVDARRSTLLDDPDGLAELETDWRAIRSDGLDAWRRSIGLGAGPVALMLGSLHDAQRIDIVQEGLRIARGRRPDLHWLVVGDGPCGERIRDAAQRAPWIRWHRGSSPRDAALALHCADLVLLPHGNGLAARRSLLAGLPIVALPAACAEPEGRWLIPNRHGVVAHRDSPSGIAAALLALLDGSLRDVVAERCRSDGRQFGLGPIAQRFCQGLLEALQGDTLRTSQGLPLPAGKAWQQVGGT